MRFVSFPAAGRSRPPRKVCRSGSERSSCPRGLRVRWSSSRSPSSGTARKTVRLRRAYLPGRFVIQRMGVCVKMPAVSSAVLVSSFLALGLAGGASGASQATAIRVATILNAAQEVPTPTGNVTAARGAFTANVNASATGATLSWELTFTGLTGNANAAHIHTAARGVAGPVSVPLCGPCQSPASGTADISAAVLQALQTGGTYVNVHTSANGPGEIRGQVAVAASVSTALSARQEVPKPKGAANRARGTFTATVVKSRRDDGRVGVASRVQQADRSRGCGAHPRRGRWTRRPGRGSALRPVPERRPQVRDAAGGNSGGSRSGPCVREHPHGAEPGR